MVHRVPNVAAAQRLFQASVADECGSSLQFVHWRADSTCIGGGGTASACGGTTAATARARSTTAADR